MLAIPARCHDGHIHLDRLNRPDIPADAEVVVVFLPVAKSLLAADELAADGLTAEQLAVLHLQSLSGFAQTDLLDPAEDVWNHV